MSESVFYDSIEPPYRIQKRLVLNQCYKIVSSEMGQQPRTLTYVTLGGSELYDVLDLLCVFDARNSQLSVVSFEQDPAVAEKSRNCHVAKALSKLKSFNLEVVSRPLAYDSLDVVARLNDRRPFIYYLDFLNPFREYNQTLVSELISTESLRPNDFLVITSSLTERVLHQASFMDGHTEAFQLYFKVPLDKVDRNFRVRNHVDLLVAQVVIERAKGDGDAQVINAKLLRKYRYKDSRTPMGVWLFKIEAIPQIPFRLHDQEFLDFPWPTQVEEETKEKSELMVTAFRAQRMAALFTRVASRQRSGVIEDGT